MSENIQSISQGTFTIGQTSATNFVAGPGIKIDEPSAGTVRIGNDETVLWSGGLTSTLSLSESMSGFDRVRFVMYCDNTNTQLNQNLIHEISWNNGNIVTMADTVRYPAIASFPIYDYRWGANIASNGKDISNVYHEMYWHPKDSWVGGGLNENAAYYPVKIIGIGRKS